MNVSPKAHAWMTGVATLTLAPYPVTEQRDRSPLDGFEFHKYARRGQLAHTIATLAVIAATVAVMIALGDLSGWQQVLIALPTVVMGLTPVLLGYATPRMAIIE